MSVFSHILVATDFGEAAQSAVDSAVRLAASCDAKLTLFHASWISPIGRGLSAEALSFPSAKLARAGEEQLRALVEKTKAHYPNTDGIAVFGKPVPAILEAAKEQGADLIVIGTHGHRGISRFLLGSVAENVLRLSPLPVLTVASSKDREAKDAGISETEFEKAG